MERVYKADPEKNNSIRLKGLYIVRLYGPDGHLKQEEISENVITSGGLEWLAAFLNSAAAAASTFSARYVAIGTDSTAAASSNTVMGTESARHTGTVSYVSNQIYKVSATFVTGYGTGAIVEYGLFNSNSAGVLVSRVTKSVINKAAGDVLTAVYQVTLS